MEHRHDSPLRIDVSAHGAAVTVIVAGELDITTATSMSKQLLTIGALHPQWLVLDLSGLDFVDVAGARALDQTYRALEAGCPVTVRQPRPSARKIFELTGFMEDRWSPPALPQNDRPRRWGHRGKHLPRATSRQARLACLVRRVVPHRPASRLSAGTPK